MVSVENLSVEFSAKPLFSEVSFVVNDRDRIALTGKNGAGKTTMLRIIAGEQMPTGGFVTSTKGTSISYLPQVMELASGRTVMEEALTAFEHIHTLQDEIEQMKAGMSERTDYESDDYLALCERYAHAEERLRMMGGMNFHAEIERTLIGLGFERNDFDRPTEQLSGGWRMRIELAKLLLRKPDVLLLDEPTNHLDIESIQWLEQYLTTQAGSVILVSHDRAFINNVTTRTLEITCGRVWDYKVRYDEYVRLRAERREQQLRAYENQLKEIADLKDFIERFRYKPTKAVQVQERIKQLERIVPIEVDEVDNSALHLKFPPCQRSGDFPLIVEDLRKAYPLSQQTPAAPSQQAHSQSLQAPSSSSQTPSQSQQAPSSPLQAPSPSQQVSSLLSVNSVGCPAYSRGEHEVIAHVNLTIRRGEKVAFVGKNGEGKSTLVKCILGQIPFEGTLKVGHNAQIGYFAQNQAQLLDPELTVFDTIDRVARGDIRTRIRDILGAFMFGGEASDKKVKVLSGGERSRLAMIRLLLEPVNFLILDEPTNHLDMRSKDVLKEAIRDFDGTVIVVSHDREFLDGLVSRVYAFGGGRVREHLGGIYDWLQETHEAATGTLRHNAESQTTPSAGSAPTVPHPAAATAARLSYEEQKALKRQQKRLADRVKAIEAEMTEVASAISILEARMDGSDPTAYERYDRLRRQQEQLENDWLEASEALEATE